MSLVQYSIRDFGPTDFGRRFAFAPSDFWNSYKDHKIGDSIIFPAAGHIDLIARSLQCMNVSFPFAAQNVAILRPFVVEENSSNLLYVDIYITANVPVRFRIYSSSKGEEVIHVIGDFKSKKTVINLSALSGDYNSYQIDEYYRHMSSIGLKYGPSYKGLQSLFHSATKAQGNIIISANKNNESSFIDPRILDSAFHVAFINKVKADKQLLYVPFSIDEIIWLKELHNNGFVLAEFNQPNVDNNKTFFVDLDLCDANSKPCIQLRGFALKEYKPIFKKNEESMNLKIYKETWNEEPVLLNPKNSGQLVLWVGYENDFCLQLLKSSGLNTRCLNPNLDSSAYTKELIERARGAEKPITIVFSTSLFNTIVPFEGVNGLTKKLVEVVMALAKGISEVPIATTVRFLTFTSPAGIGIESNISNLISRSLVGIFRSLVLEIPNLEYSFVNLSSEFSMQATLEVFNFFHGQEVKYKNGIRYVRKLDVLNKAKSSQSVSFSSDRWHIITGGMGNLGMQLAEYLIGKGALKIVLVGRSKPSEQISKQIDSFAQKGAKVIIKNFDISNIVDTFLHLSEFRNEVAGIYHLAGLIVDAPAVNMNWDHFDKVMRPKVMGSWNLHEFSKNQQIDYFVLFSSQSGFIGNSGQANYSFANVFLDELSEYRINSGLPSTSIAWGPWADIGMAAKPEVIQRMRARGVELVSLKQGFQMMTDAIESRQHSVAVMNVNWSKFIPDAKRRPNWMAGFSNLKNEEITPNDQINLNKIDSSRSTVPEVPIQNISASDKSTSDKVEVPERFSGLSSFELEQSLQKYLQEEIAKIMGFSTADKVSIDAPLMEIGLDSLMGVELRNRLASDLKVNLNNSFIFKYPTVVAIAGHIVELFSPAKISESAQGPGVSLQNKIESNTKNQQSTKNDPVSESVVPAPTGQREVVEKVQIPERFLGLSSDQLETALQSYMREEVAKIMGFSSADKVSIDAPLMEVGLDSLMAVELRNRLASDLGVNLHTSFIFKLPTIVAIASHLMELFSGANADKKSDFTFLGSPVTTQSNVENISVSEHQNNSSEYTENIKNLSDDEVLDILMKMRRAS